MVFQAPSGRMPRPGNRVKPARLKKSPAEAGLELIFFGSYAAEGMVGAASAFRR